MVEALLDALGIGLDAERATRVERAHALGIVAPDSRAAAGDRGR
jgi:hypothetical protein